MNRFCLLLLIISNFLNLNGQSRVKIAVLSPAKEVQPGAYVQVRRELQNFTGITDSSGSCRFFLYPVKYEVQVHLPGFAEYKDSIDFSSQKSVTVFLRNLEVQGEEVIISGRQPDNNIKSSETGVTTLKPQEIRNFPRLIGETDAIKVLQYTPGVTLSGEGNSGMYVRGGANDQNLVLLDGATIFNPAHLLGIFSVFNTDIIKDVSLYKSSIPASFGGRISSVLDIETIDGINQKTDGQGSVGLISSKLFVKGPFLNKKASFYLSARKSYLNTLIKPASKLILDQSDLMFRDLSYDFYDLNAGISYRPSDKDNLQLSVYHGNDHFGLDKPELWLSNIIDWKNTAGSIQWRHAFSENTFLRVLVSSSLYNFDFLTSQNQSEFQLNSDIREKKGHVQITKMMGRHHLMGGIEIKSLYSVPNDRRADIEQTEINFNFRNNYQGYEYAAFLKDQLEIGKKWSINFGYRHSFYQQVGPYKNYTYNDQNVLTDSAVYKKNQTVSFYHLPEIRTSVRYLIREDLSVKASFNTSAQYLNQVTTSAVSLPSDFWVLSSSNLRPQHGVQAGIGMYRNFHENAWESSVELFYKTMSNQLEYYNSIFNTRKILNFEDNFISGRGLAFGAEFFLKKKKGKTTGWVSYSISRTLRKFSEINDGEWFPAKYDRIHDGSIIVVHTLNNQWTLSAVFVYTTGEAFTIPVARYIVQGNLLNQYGDYNGYRLPDYHRLDLSATMKLRQSKRIRSELTFSIYNVYNRQNPIFLYNEAKGNLDKYQLNVTPKQLALLPVLPSVSWNFSF